MAAASSRKPDKPVLLSGGNPQIAKGYGDAPVQGYIAAMPGWKCGIGSRIDTITGRAVPGLRKAVKWNSPFYGVADEEMGWFLSYHCFTRYVKVTFFRGASLEPPPPGKSKISRGPLSRHPRRRIRRGPVRRLGQAGEPIARRKIVNVLAKVSVVAGSVTLPVILP